MNEKRIVAVIPSLNEEKTILGVIKGVRKYVSEIILVDDASTDKTAVIAQREGALILSHKKNQGYDKSIDDGFVLAAKRGANIILTFDADGQHNPADIPEIIKPLLDGVADVSVGRRPYHARISEYLFGFISKRKIGVDDPLCGLKAYSIDVYKDIGYFDRISSIGTQLMFNARKKGYKVVQKNIKLNKRKDISRFGKSIRANWKIFKAIFKILLLEIRINKSTLSKQEVPTK